MTTGHQQTVANLNACFDSMDELFGSLTDEQWVVRSYPPEWDVTGVMLHLAAVEHMLVGQPPSALAESLPFEAVGAFMAEVDSLGPAALLERYRSRSKLGDRNWRPSIPRHSTCRR